ncbi:MAG: hypothetical protein IPO66_16440 [Rhodanobacteraceae bacterium]|nr:hypothetical protein [Rhodanobacteraceae bacterium]
MAAMAEDFRRAFEAQLGRQLPCDGNGVRVLEQIIEEQRLQFEAPPQKMLMGIAAVLGEILVRQFGATWISHKDGYAVRFEANSGVVPLERVARQWDKGGAGGNTLSALFETIRQRKAGANADARTQTPASQAVDAQAPQAASPAPSSRFRIAAQVPDTQMAQLIEKTRSKIAGLRQTAATGTLKRMRAENPTWVTYRDPLHEVSRQQDLLLAEGEVVWAALVMANQLLFQAGHEDCPGLLAYSTDPYFDARPHELQAIARPYLRTQSTVPEDRNCGRWRAW